MIRVSKRMTVEFTKDNELFTSAIVHRKGNGGTDIGCERVAQNRAFDIRRVNVRTKQDDDVADPVDG